MSRIALVRIAAAFCFVAVALGAFGAHALKEMLQSSGMLDAWNKAVLYHLVHAVALLALALYGAGNRGLICCSLPAFCFSVAVFTQWR
jgi:uncharacterized membrane protein YgdD (TMEM256/DUF423 family)